MKTKIADSVIISATNLLVIAISYGLPSFRKLNDVSAVLALTVVPIVFLLTVIYTVRDLIRPGKRKQAVVASVLLLPTVVFLGSIKL
jgi:hypothetical protein